MQRPDHELQTRIKACESPTFGYRRGEDGEIEKDIFDGQIPEGWVDSPAKVGKCNPRPTVEMWTFGPEATEILVPDIVVPTEDEKVEPTPDGSGLSGGPYEDRTFNDLRAELIRRGEKWRRSDNKAAVIGRLKDMDDGNLG